ncbi:MAG: SGNH/GDSL hydrolase family protein [Verrucomicrobiota bacterium]
MPGNWRIAVPAFLAVAVAACTAVPISRPLSKSAPSFLIAEGERWDPVSVCGQIFLRTETTVGPGDRPPFEMIVLGDSIVWGQGLPEEQKSSTLVQRWLAERIARPVRKRVYAHSGATVEQDGTRLTLAHSEVPDSSPHIALQAECVPNPGAVGLVIVNGCINDVDATAIFDPTTDPDLGRIEEACACKCGEPMRTLLTAIARRFPNARVVVPGYYPFFSQKTPRMSLRFVTLLFLLVADSQNEPPSWSDCGKRLIRKSAVWYQVSNATLARAVGEANREQGVSGRVVFAPVPVLDENAYGAPRSLLWGVTEHDNVALSRWWECLRREKIMDRMRCINASAFHPNAAGAKVYADAIIGALDPPTLVETPDGKEAP